MQSLNGGSEGIFLACIEDISEFCILSLLLIRTLFRKA